MLYRIRSGRWRVGVSAAVSLVVVGALCTPTLSAQAPLSAQVISTPLELPKGPGTPGFDLARLNTENYGAFEPFYVTETQPLKKALDEGKLAQDTRLLVMETAGGKLAFLADQMAYHHLAQGRDGGKDWMVTF